MFKLILGAACACFMAGCSQKSEVPAQSAVPAPPALLSGIDVQYIDDGVRAQDDFYKHVNGKWLVSTEIPADKAEYGSFDKRQDADGSTHRCHQDRSALAAGRPGYGA